MGDLTDLRRRAAQQAGTGNYWAGKVVALIDRLDRVQPAIDWMWKDHQCQRPDLEAIVRDLAQLHAVHTIECHCQALEHKPECPWRQAVEWVRAQEGT